jgi:hypothetical protein
MPTEELEPTTPPAALAPAGRTPIEIADRGIILRSFAELQRFAQLVLESGAAPKGIDTAGKVAVAIQMGMERGMAPLGGLRAVFFVNGLPSWRGEAAVAIVRQSPLCMSYRAWIEGEGDERRGVCETHRRGDPAPVQTIFSVRDAMRAGLWSKAGPWKEYPDRQLRWRAIGFNLRDQFSDLLGGFPITEELRDIPGEQPVEAPRAERQPAAAPPPDPLLATLVEAPAASRTESEAKPPTLLQQLKDSLIAGSKEASPKEPTQAELDLLAQADE